jgi:hypothetical protein
VIDLQGGGACYDKQSCDKRAKEALGTSTKWGPTASCTLCNNNPSSNPDFFDANHVHIPYCTGDVHSGQRKTASDDTWGLYFDGRLNVERIVADLKATKGLGSATHVTVTGGSAGGG